MKPARAERLDVDAAEITISAAIDPCRRRRLVELLRKIVDKDRRSGAR